MVDSRYNVVFDDMDVDVRGTASYEGIFILRSTKREFLEPPLGIVLLM